MTLDSIFFVVDDGAPSRENAWMPTRLDVNIGLHPWSIFFQGHCCCLVIWYPYLWKFQNIIFEWKGVNDWHTLSYGFVELPPSLGKLTRPTTIFIGSKFVSGWCCNQNTVSVSATYRAYFLIFCFGVPVTPPRIPVTKDDSLHISVGTL